MKILITGAKGQLGQEFVKRLEKEVFEEYKPEMVINCSAYNLVDRAEEKRETVYKTLVNSGYTSRFEWAREYFRLKGINKFIYPAYQFNFNLPAQKPRFSAISNEKICKALGIEIKEWKEKLREFER